MSDSSETSSGGRKPATKKRRWWPQMAMVGGGRLVLMLVLLAFLVVGVVLPVLEIVKRSVSTEVAVVIFGREDIRIGGRRISLDSLSATVDGVRFSDLSSPVEHDGVRIVQEQNGACRISVNRIELDDRDRRIPAIVLDVSEEGGFILDGRRLGDDERQFKLSRYIGIANFTAYFRQRAMYQSLFHSLFVSVVSTVVAVTLAFVYAYGLTRTCMPAKGIFRLVSMLPLFAPSMLYGLSLVYMFGNQGVITTGFFGHVPWLAWDINLYGPVGIILALVTFSFPPATMIIQVALRNTDARLYEASDALSASPWRTFLTVTLPSAKYGVISAAFVCFTLAFTDFGAPKIVGGNYSVLAVDIYKQVIGQQNFNMASVVSILLLLPAGLAFVVTQLVQRKQQMALSSKSKPLIPRKRPLKDGILLGCCALIALYVVAMMFTAGVASLVKRWPYDFSLSLASYSFDGVSGGYTEFFNSLRVAGASAVIGTAVTFLLAYLIEKGVGYVWLRKVLGFLSLIPLALPGLVIGIAYIFFFSQAQWRIPFTPWTVANPLVGIYGTMAILVLSNIVHVLTVSTLTHSTALKQLDKEFEQVSESMAVPFYRTLRRVTIPMTLPAILEVATYLFVSSMATVSAVIFLYGSKTRLASIAVVNMNDAGDVAPAAAMSMLIVLTNLAVRGLMELLVAGLKKKTQAWRGT